jgi:uncharacterized DUF497 family protein
MLIVWDEPKRLANIDKHGLDFATLSYDFFLGSMVMSAKHGRHMALGRLDDGTVAVVFASLGNEALTVISMRPASKTERRLLNDTEEKPARQPNR